VAVDWPATLSALLAHEPLDRASARAAMSAILRGDVDATLIAAFLTALTTCPETVDELTGFVEAMMDVATTIDVPPGTMDIVGTGGDHSGSVNVSTMAALAVAACGVPVAKHGNRAASSRVGAADVLEALGVRIDAPPAVVARCVADVGMGFCFAPVFHPGMAHLGPVRRQLGFPTVMNLLGPLANPGRVRRLVVGAARGDVVDVMAGVLVARGVERAAVVHGDDGLDELSLGAPSTVIDISPSGVTPIRFDPLTLGPRHTTEEIRGGDLTVNADVVRRFLSGVPGAIFDVVTANAGLALVVAGRVDDIASGVRIAADAVTDGSARRLLAALVAASNSN
jgi:anthranilate phosphoribosyltransferase